MKIQYCSDLHLEFSENLKWLKQNPLIPVGDILVIAGDTIYIDDTSFKLSFFDWLSDNFNEVYLIPGNHEYYGGYDISNSYPKLEIEIRHNVKMVNNICIKKGQTKLIFSTLWSHLKNNVEFIYLSMADFYFGKFKHKSFVTGDYNSLHKQSLKFISDSINDQSRSNNIIISHHLPSRHSYCSSIKDSFLIDAYCTDLSSFIKNHSIDYWIHGHSHNNIEPYKIGRTSILTNQLGYVSKGENLKFDNHKYIVV